MPRSPRLSSCGAWLLLSGIVVCTCFASPPAESAENRGGFTAKDSVVRGTSSGAEHFPSAAQRRAYDKEQKRRDQAYQDRVGKVKVLRSWLRDSDLRRQAQGRERLLRIDQGDAVPALVNVLSPSGTLDERLLLVEVLLKIKDPRASQALTYLAMVDPSPAIRDLAHRNIGDDARGYLPVLIWAVRSGDPEQIQAAADRAENYGAIDIMVPALLDSFVSWTVTPSKPPAIKGQQIVREEENLGNAYPFIFRRRDGSLGPINEIRVTTRIQALVPEPISTEPFQRHLAARNDAIAAALAQLTGENQGRDAGRWKSWWARRSLRERSAGTDPLIYRNGWLADGEELLWLPPRPAGRISVPDFVYEYSLQTQVLSDFSYLLPSGCCFAKGTPVWTATGLRPIESVAVGDEVLAQDPLSGELGYRPVESTRTSLSDELMRLDVGVSEVLVTPKHRFWVAGQGWTEARDLRPGMRLLDQAGEAIELDAKPAWVTGDRSEVVNLEVAGWHSFFVGSSGIWVEDRPQDRPTCFQSSQQPLLLL